MVFEHPVTYCSASNIGNRAKEGAEEVGDRVKEGWRNPTKQSAYESPSLSGMDEGVRDGARDAWENTKDSGRRTRNEIDDAARRSVPPPPPLPPPTHPSLTP